MLEPAEIKVIAFVRASIQNWNKKNIDAMAARFRDDAVLSSLLRWNILHRPGYKAKTKS
jgi:hypothetical protein